MIMDAPGQSVQRTASGTMFLAARRSLRQKEHDDYSTLTNSATEYRKAGCIRSFRRNKGCGFGARFLRRIEGTGAARSCAFLPSVNTWSCELLFKFHLDTSDQEHSAIRTNCLRVLRWSARLSCSDTSRANHPRGPTSKSHPSDARKALVELTKCLGLATCAILRMTQLTQLTDRVFEGRGIFSTYLVFALLRLLSFRKHISNMNQVHLQEEETGMA